VAVIGGGIAGCSIAYAFGKRGWDVTLFERDTIASQGSGNHVAVLQPGLSLHPSPPSMLASLGFACTRRILEERHTADHAIPHGWGGAFYPACPVSVRARLQRLASSHQAFVSTRWLEASETTKVGWSMAGEGLWMEQGGWVSPASFCRALLQLDSIKVLEQTEVSAMSHDGEQWRLRGVDGTALGLFPVVCLAYANDAIGDSLLAGIPLFSVRGQVIYVKESELSSGLRSVLCGGGTITPAYEGWHVLGATFARDDLEGSLRQSDRDAILERLHASYPALSSLFPDVSRATEGRVGWRNVSENRMPLVGPVPVVAAYREMLEGVRPQHIPTASDVALYHPGLYASLAHGSRGFVTAPLAGELLACLLSGEGWPIDERMWQALHLARFVIREWQKGRL
jgi:tRNA 5-methylaminomethyl-2-thiouridine biosynthesis bifunctional protein